MEFQNKKNGRRSSLWCLSAIIVLLASLLTYLCMKYGGDAHEAAELLQGYDVAAIALHEEHFRQDPTKIHVLWWDDRQPGAVGVALHVLPSAGYAEGSETMKRGVWTLIQAYNRIPLGQACYLALQGDHSSRVVSVMNMAAALYRTRPETDFAERLRELAAGNSTSAHEFRETWERLSGTPPYREYVAGELMPRVALWATNSCRPPVTGSDSRLGP